MVQGVIARQKALCVYNIFDFCTIFGTCGSRGWEAGREAIKIKFLWETEVLFRVRGEVSHVCLKAISRTKAFITDNLKCAGAGVQQAVFETIDGAAVANKV